MQEQHRHNPSLSWLKARVQLRERNLGISTTRAMLDLWREQVPSEKAHFREFSGLPGTKHKRWLPIENHNTGTAFGGIISEPRSPRSFFGGTMPETPSGCQYRNRVALGAFSEGQALGAFSEGQYRNRLRGHNTETA